MAYIVIAYPSCTAWDHCVDTNNEMVLWDSSKRIIQTSHLMFDVRVSRPIENFDNVPEILMCPEMKFEQLRQLKESQQTTNKTNIWEFNSEFQAKKFLIKANKHLLAVFRECMSSLNPTKYKIVKCKIAKNSYLKKSHISLFSSYNNNNNNQ
jgi:hypothetical protein